jgi:hypothetical protein
VNTRLKGDIAEQAATLQALRRGWGVLRPVGDRLPYDLVFDVSGALTKVQIKSAWLDDACGKYVVDIRRTRTNRRLMVRQTYQPTDFEFALVYLDRLDLFYVFPVEVFLGYGSEIHMVEAEKRQRKPTSAEYRDAWHLILHWAAREETRARSPVKFGEAVSGVTPSQALEWSDTSEKV